MYRQNNSARHFVPAHRLHRARRSKQHTFIIAVAAILCSIISCVTVAYIFTRTDPIKNTFTPAQVSCEVLENFENNVKTDVRIQNTGDTDAFIRVAIVATWVSASGENIVSALCPVAGVDYNITFSDDFSDHWLKDGNEFYYYKHSVDANGETAQLIKECSVVQEKVPEGFYLSVEIVASAIQSSPDTVASEQWGVTINDATIVSVPTKN